jgi:hypothetical protein
MKYRTIGNHLVVTASLAAAVSLTACASGVANLVRDSRLSIKTESPRKVTLSVSGIYQRGENVEVTGRVWRSRLSLAGLYSGHVDVEIANPDGTVAASTGVATTPRFIKRGLGRGARFSTQVAARIERGTAVRLSFHRGKHDNEV